MSFTIPRPPALRDATPRLRSDCLWSWDGAAADLNATTGHVGIFARATTLASVLDGAGGTYTAPHSMPAWEIRDVDGAPACGLRMAGSDRLHFDPAPQGDALAGVIEFVETGARTGSSGSTLFALCNDAVSGGRLWIDTSGSTGGRYGINYSSGATTRTARLTTGAPAPDDVVRLRWERAVNGAVQIWQSINGAAETTASAASLVVVPWATGAVIRLNSRGDTENPAQGWYRRAKVVAGNPDLATLLAVR